MSENVECVWAEINKDQRLTVWELQAYLGIPKTTAWDFNAVSWHEICHGKMLPQLLLQEQKEHHAAVANGLIQTATNEPDFLKKVINLKGTEVSLSHVQCFLYLLQETSLFVILHGWILSGKILYITYNILYILCIMLCYIYINYIILH